jgi:hypothetical protein
MNFNPMKLLKIIFAFSYISYFTEVVFGAESSILSIVFRNNKRDLIPLAFGLCLLYFLGVVKYIKNEAGRIKRLKKPGR